MKKILRLSLNLNDKFTPVTHQITKLSATIGKANYVLLDWSTKIQLKHSDVLTHSQTGEHWKHLTLTERRRESQR